MAKKKIKISAKERKRRSLQAKKNFGISKRGRRMAKKKYKRKKQNSGFQLPSGMRKLALPVGSMLYGAIREKISLAIANTELAKKLPISNYTDEAVMLGLNYAATKFLGLGKVPIVNSGLRTGKGVEWARIGEQAARDMNNKQQVSTDVSGSTYIF